MIRSYFDCTAALDDSCATRAPVEPPSCALLASPVLLRLVGFGSAGRRRSFEGSRQSESVLDQIRRQ